MPPKDYYPDYGEDDEDDAIPNAVPYGTIYNRTVATAAEEAARLIAREHGLIPTPSIIAALIDALTTNVVIA